jgi:hypothetical protein
MDLEAAKKQLLIPWKWQWKSKRVIMTMEMTKSRKETIIVNQPENNTPPRQPQKKRKVGVVRLGAVIGQVGAATGAIISKKVQGAIMVVAGAGVGAGTGAIIDGSKIKRNFF